MAIRTIDRSGDDVRIVVADELTPRDTADVAAMVRQLTEGTRVTIDLRHARSCPAHALLMLSEVRLPTGARPAFVGLTGSSWKLLQYLGVQPRGGGEAEDAR